MARRKRSERLRTLLDLARLREDDAARSLSSSSERLQQAELQSRQLSEYSREYEQQFGVRTRQALSVHELRNYQGFFQQLDSVQHQQQRTIEACASEREQARQHWLLLYQRRRALDRIAQRARAGEEAQQERRLQAEFDDLAARRDRD